jgi:hypothetical protein
LLEKLLAREQERVRKHGYSCFSVGSAGELISIWDNVRFTESLSLQIAIAQPGLLLIYCITIHLVLPIVFGTGASWILRRFSHRLTIVGLDEVARTLYAWMYIGSRKEGSYVRIWLKSNSSRAVAGKLSNESFVPMEEDQPDLFLKVVWDDDENSWFLCPSRNSAGIWFTRESIDRVEFTREVQTSEHTSDTESKPSEQTF